MNAAILAAMALALGQEARLTPLENQIRDTYASEYQVMAVEMHRQADGTVAGFARLRAAGGAESYLECSAPALDPGQESHAWGCQDGIDAAAIDRVEAEIGQSLAANGTVLEVAMLRVDPDRMAGFARMRLASGMEIRMACQAERNRDDTANFLWDCTEA